MEVYLSIILCPRVCIDVSLSALNKTPGNNSGQRSPFKHPLK
jgi:hypothetical protein